MHENSRLLFKKYALPYLIPGRRVLEIGPDASPSTYRKIADPQGILDWQTAELQSSIARSGYSPYSEGRPSEIDFVMLDENTVNCPDEHFDLVISGQVLEHVRRPWVWMREMARLVRCGGHVITIVPVSWPYHEAPIDCWRILPEGLGALYEEAGLTPVVLEWESLESVKSRNRYPGPSYEPPAKPTIARLRSMILDQLGWPRPSAFDTIGIARK